MKYKPLLVGAALLVAACGTQPAPEQNRATEDSPDAGESRPPAASGAPNFLYPGSAPAGAADRFATSEPIDKVVEWYRDPARRNEMMYASSEKRDDGYLVIGTAGEDGDSFALLLKPAGGGGTEIQSLPYDPKKGLKL